MNEPNSRRVDGTKLLTSSATPKLRCGTRKEFRALLICMLSLAVVPAQAVEPIEPTAVVAGIDADPLAGMPDAEAGRLRQIVGDLIRSSIPETYQNEKDWGHQKRIYAGVKVRRDGWKIDTKRRWREVNHGAWTRYEIRLIDPDQHMKADLHDLRWLPDGTATFQLTLAGRLNCFARRSRWNYGVQLWSFNVDADADIEITIVGSIGVGLDYVNIPPDVVVKPVIESAQIAVPRFEVNRISEVGGDFAEGIGDALEGILRDEIISKQQVKLVERMNRQIARKEETLRFSMSDWLSKLLSDKTLAAEKAKADLMPGRP